MKAYVLLSARRNGYILKEVVPGFDVAQLAENNPGLIYMYVESDKPAFHHTDPRD